MMWPKASKMVLNINYFFLFLLAFESCTSPTKSIDDACKCVEAISESDVTTMQVTFQIEYLY